MNEDEAPVEKSGFQKISNYVLYFYLTLSISHPISSAQRKICSFFLMELKHWCETAES